MSERRTLRRQSLIVAAAEVFTEAGFADTPLTAVADRAGVTRMLLYRYFESKEELYLAVIDQVAELLTRQLAEIPEPVTSTAVSRAHFAVAAELPAGYRLLWERARTESTFARHTDALVARVHKVAADLLVGYADFGALADWAAEVATGVSVNAALGWLDHLETVDRAVAERFADDGLAGLVTGWVLLLSNGVSPEPEELAETLRGL